MRGLLLGMLVFLAGCAGFADGEWERLYNTDYNNELTQIPEKQDFRTFRQQLPNCLLP